MHNHKRGSTAYNAVQPAEVGIAVQSFDFENSPANQICYFTLPILQCVDVRWLDWPVRRQERRLGPLLEPAGR
jgi:hypothetical protein